MKTSDQINELAAALSKAQGELKNIEKGKINPHLKSKYADIADGLEVIRPVLAKHNLSVIQATDVNPDTGVFTLHTRLMHSSGQWIESTYPLMTGKPQEQGSAITYARRYSLFSLIGTAGTNEDDDGHAANNAAPAPAKATFKKTPTVDKEELLAKANEVAAKGTDALRAWWPKLPQAERTTLTTEEIEALKAAAAQVDAGKGEAE